MKRIALITTNKILAQSLDFAIQSIEDMEFDFTLLLNSKQALLDAQILNIDVALIDVTDDDVKENEATIDFCERLHNILPNCHILLIVSQDNKGKRIMAMEAKKMKLIEDYVFYDSSLKYLLAKVSAF